MKKELSTQNIELTPSREIFEFNISDIKQNTKYWAREELNKDTINRLIVCYKNRNELPPITVNENGVLIDGWHTLRAAEIIGLKKVNSSVVEIPESEIYVEGIRLNRKKGLPYTINELKQQVVYLEQGINKTYAELIEIYGEFPLQELEELSFAERLPTKHPKIYPILKRNGINSDEILKRLNEGESALSISSALGINPSNLNTLDAQEPKAGVKIIADVAILDAIFKPVLFMSRSNRRVNLNFEKEGLYIDIYEPNNFMPSEFLIIPSKCFIKYEVMKHDSIIIDSYRLFGTIWLNKVTDIVMLATDRLPEIFDSPILWTVRPDLFANVITGGGGIILSGALSFREGGSLSKCEIKFSVLINDLKLPASNSYHLKITQGTISVYRKEKKPFKQVKEIPLTRFQGQSCKIIINSNFIQKILESKQKRVDFFIDVKRKIIYAKISYGAFWHIITSKVEIILQEETRNE